MPSYTSVRADRRCLLVKFGKETFDRRLLERRLERFWIDLDIKKRREDYEANHDEDTLSWPEIFDENPSTVIVPTMVTSKIRRRVSRYLYAVSKDSGANHLKPDDRQRLSPVSGLIDAAYIDESGADRLASDLHDQYPWHAAATEHVWLQLRQSAKTGTPAHVGPLLFDGPPGVGKSAWSRSLASMLQCPRTSIDASSSNSGFAVSGLEKGYHSAQPGRPIELILQHAHACPVVVVDEVCKAGTMLTNRGVEHSITECLLGLLEPVSAANYECPYFRVSFDLSTVSWILTCNYLHRVPEPLRTRCAIVRSSPLSDDDLLLVAGRLADEHGLSVASREAALDAVEMFSSRVKRTVDLRDVRRIIDRAQALETRPVLH